MGLQPLEFSECLTDSPGFRDKLHSHEKELARTSKGIKQLISESKEVLAASLALSKAQLNFARTLTDFQFECIGDERTDDEVTIEKSLKEFARLLGGIETERDLLNEGMQKMVIEPLERFRKEQIGDAKEQKRRFDKLTSKYCTSVDKYLALKQSKTTDAQLQEADATVNAERRTFLDESMQYVMRLQEVQERKKFEFVEILLQFVNGWLTFYHVGYDLSDGFKPNLDVLSLILQKCRSNFELTKDEATILMKKMLEQPQDHCGACKPWAREGYLYLLEKKALGTTWTKYYCQYLKEDRSLSMTQYSQVTGKSTLPTTDRVMLMSCTRRATDSIDKRFCFDITIPDRTQPLTLQAMSEENQRQWLEAMDGTEPIYQEPAKNTKLDSQLDEVGFQFIKKCIEAIEARGLEEEGLYRVVGVNSKVAKLSSLLLDGRKADRVDLIADSEWEVKTITSALKNYFRSLPEPLMTFTLHKRFIQATKQELKPLRVKVVQELVRQLPQSNFDMLRTLVAHLKQVSESSAKNLMSVANLGVCFGPTLMRPEEETMAAIMDIKFSNLVIELLIEHQGEMFKSGPESPEVAPGRIPTSASKGPAPPPPRGAPPAHPSVPPPAPPGSSAPSGAPAPLGVVASVATSSVIQGRGSPAFARRATASQPSSSSSAAAVQAALSSSQSSSRPQAAVGNSNATSSNLASKSASSSSSLAASTSPQGIPAVIPPLNPATSPNRAVTASGTSSPLGFSVGGGPPVSANKPLCVTSPAVTSPPVTSSEEGNNSTSGHLRQASSGGGGFTRAVGAGGVGGGGVGGPWHGDEAGEKYAQSRASLRPTAPAVQTGSRPVGAVDHHGNGSEPPGTKSSNSSLSANAAALFPADSQRPRQNQSSIAPVFNIIIVSQRHPAFSLHMALAVMLLRRAKTLYACEAENESELSFEPNVIIERVRESKEPGWLEGMLNGRTGLIPQNYVEFLP